MLVAGEGHEGIVEQLLAHPDIQVNLIDDEGFSALMKAAGHGYEGIVKLILARSDILINLVSIDGWSALMLAACGGHESIVRMLLDAAPINEALKTMESRHTAMLLALAKGHTGIVRLLEEFESRQTRIDSEDLTDLNMDQLSLEEAIDEELGSESDSEKSDMYYDAEE
ncbi:ankyrin repeat-containing domain protein [Coprinopsis sp. MPI-PUGE-AT-0042]|nr:ankyrin repeat-containing domain protein [Coprinopsis sp. MPI-PUGE-AT-0042]